MAQTKHANLRYRVLDRCFSNFGRKYFIEDLLFEINRVLEEEEIESIKERQLRDDIAFLRSALGGAHPIETLKDGKRGYYRYEKEGYSIFKSPLSENEVYKLGSTLEFLGKFEGMPGFEWISQTKGILKDAFKLENDKKVLFYEQNLDYAGEKFITPLFNAIVNKRVLEVVYQPFTAEKQSLIFHPAILKQFNGRWFAFGYNATLEKDIWNLALDRIEQIKELTHKYIESEQDWESYFFDFIGVTDLGNEVEEVHLLFNAEIKPYIKTKSLHPTQKDYEMEDGSLLVKLKVKPNRELLNLILSFGKNVVVIQPETLKNQVIDNLKKGLENY